MRINNNLMAMNTHRQLGINAGNGAKSIEKLSSGYRINRAGDDAAGLAISEKMRAQIRGLSQASRNSQDAISLVQTAEGALNETQDILQRMRELAVQSANDTNVTVDRSAIQNEVDQLTEEIDRIANTTEFNTRKLLNGGAGIKATITSDGTAALATGLSASVVSGSNGVLAGGDLVMADVDTADKARIEIDATAALTAGSAGGSLEVNGITVSFAAGANAAAIVSAFNAVSEQSGVTASYDSTNFTLILESNAAGADAKIDLSGITKTAVSAAGDTFGATLAAVDKVTDGVKTSVLTASALASATVITANGENAELANTTGTTGNAPTSWSASGNNITFHGGDYDGLTVKVSGFTGQASDDVNVHIDANDSLSMQIGANEGQDMSVSIGDMRAAALGVNSIDVTSPTNAKTAISTIQDAITSVSSERAKLGAVQNRLEHTIKNLDTSAENLQASESRIRDVDMAKEMMNFTKNNILQQAAQAMLAQANQAPQGVLQLLR